jgi:hypothetical protein
MKKGVIIFLIALSLATGLYVLYRAAIVDGASSEEILYPEINVPEGAEVMAPAEVSINVDTSPAAEIPVGVRYVGTSPEECAVIRFVCEEDEEYFSDAVGCGCQIIE